MKQTKILNFLFLGLGVVLLSISAWFMYASFNLFGAEVNQKSLITSISLAFVSIFAIYSSLKNLKAKQVDFNK